MNNKEIAQEILRQLGGKKFIAMTGSKNFTSSKNDKGEAVLTMHLTKNKSKAKYLSITLNSLDLYDLEFSTTNKDYEYIVVETHNDVYNDMLQEIFTSVTGLDTHL